MPITYEQFESLVRDQLVNYRGDAYHAFRESLIFNLQEVGYSGHRAAQVVDATVKRHRRSKR